jgi:hypothetical protein
MTASSILKRNAAIWAISLVAGVFGLLTLQSGGSVLFIDGEARLAAGHYVPFVVWFNFFAGFFYVVAAIALWMMRPWAAWLSLLIVGSTLTVFAAFGLHVLNGGEYETRTVFAMILRSSVWITISLFAWHHLLRQ